MLPCTPPASDPRLPPAGTICTQWWAGVGDRTYCTCTLPQELVWIEGVGDKREVWKERQLLPQQCQEEEEEEEEGVRGGSQSGLWLDANSDY